MEDADSTPVALRLLLRVVWLGVFVVGLFLAGLMLAGPALAAPDGGESSGSDSASGTTSGVVHAVRSHTTPDRSTSEPEQSGKSTSGKATTGKATTGKATTGKATTGKATTGKATTGKATSSGSASGGSRHDDAASAARREADTSTTSQRGGALRAVPRARIVEHEAAAPRRSATSSRTKSAVTSPVRAATSGSLAPRVTAPTVHLATDTLDRALAPAAPVTSPAIHASPAASSLLASTAALPRTLTRTGGTLVDTVTGLTPTTTALTRAVGTLAGRTTGLTPEALLGPAASDRTPGAEALTAPSAVPGLPGTSADRPVATASSSAVPGAVVRESVPGGVAGPWPAASGSPGAPWSGIGATTGPVAQHVVPGAPVPGAPMAPAAPAGTPGVSLGSGAGVLLGLLTDPLALPAILAALVLSACGRRWSWWFPEVAVGPD